MIKCEKGKKIFNECYRKRWQTFCDVVNVHVFNIGIICIHGKITQTIYILSNVQKIAQWNRRSTNLRNWCLNRMRSMEWRQLTGKTLHGSVCLRLVMNKSSVFSAQESTSFQILYCVLVRYTRTTNQTLHGNKDYSCSKVHHNAELWTQLMVSQWNSSGISSQDSQHCSSAAKSNIYCCDWVKHQRILQDGLSTCRCSTTSHGDQETMKNKAIQMLDSFLCLQENLEQDNGHSLVLVQRKSGTLSVKIVHKVNATKFSN